MKNNRSGFTLLEVLISLSLFLLIFILALKITATNKRIFHNLKKDEETLEFCFSAIEKIRIDVLKAGELLGSYKKLELLKCIQIFGNKLIIRYGEQNSHLLKDVNAGSEKIEIVNSSNFKKNRKIIIWEGEKGEICEILKKQGSSLILKNPLCFNYKKEEAEVILIKEISYFLDHSKNTLRREVNNSSAQPLIEKITFFEANYLENKNLLSIKFEKENRKAFQILIFLKNLSFFGRRE